MEKFKKEQSKEDKSKDNLSFKGRFDNVVSYAASMAYNGLIFATMGGVISVPVMTMLTVKGEEQVGLLILGAVSAGGLVAGSIEGYKAERDRKKGIYRSKGVGLYD